MDFSLTDDQRQIVDSVRRYVARDYDFERRRAILGSDAGWSPQVWRDFADLGLLGLAVPEADGGLGASVADLLLVSAALGDGLIVEPFLSSAIVATRAVALLGSPAQRADWLAQFAAGSLVAVLAHDPGSAALGEPPVRAVADGDGWLLRGDVPLVDHAPAAGLLLVPASSDGASEPEALFAVPAAAPGLTLARATTVDGHCAGDLELRDVRVGAAGRLAGPVPAALAEVLDLGTVALCGEALGVLDRTLALTVEYVRNRSQFGGPIGRFQVLQHRLVDMLTQIEQARSLAYLAAGACTDGSGAERAAAVSAAKVVVSHAARGVGQQAVQLHGGMGVTEDMAISHYFRRLVAIERRFGSADAHLSRYLDVACESLGF